MLNENDLNLLKEKGISEETVNAQIKRFETGFPYLRLQGAATPENGITVLDEATQDEAIERWDEYLADGGEVIKMVPASGAASRMFKALFSFADGDTDEATGSVKEVLDNIPNISVKSISPFIRSGFVSEKKPKEKLSGLISVFSGT